MSNNTQAVFDTTAATYDRDRMKLIPRHEAFYAAALECIPVEAQTIVDLGAGSGLFSAMLREAFPRAHLHLIDFSATMLTLARERLGLSQSITYIQADYTTEPLPHDCDAVVSALSIHHLDDDTKCSLFAHILSALRPGGGFVNAEQILQPTPELEVLAKQGWLEEVRSLGATEQQIADSLFRQHEDRCSTIDNQLAWMSAAGFANARCIFAAGRFAVLTANRP